MRTRNKHILILAQLVILGVIVFAISGTFGLVAMILGEISIPELLAYFEGLLTGESLVIGGTFLKMNWKKIVDDFWDWIEGKDEHILNQKIDELRRLLRK